MDFSQFLNKRKKLRKNKNNLINQKNISTKFLKSKQKQNTGRKKLFNKKLIISFVLLFLLFIILFIAFKIIKPSLFGKSKTETEKELSFDLDFTHKNSKMKRYEELTNKNPNCDLLDPIYLFQERLNKGNLLLCSGEKSKHICYLNYNNPTNDKYLFKDGIICTLENIIIDPSFSRQSGLSFTDGPVDTTNHGFPLLSKGFICAECKYNNSISLRHNSNYYSTYFNSWNYEYDIKKEEKDIEELAQGKMVFLLSRNQDDPNLFHGGSEVINAVSMMYLLNLEPKDIQIIFLESIEIPYYEEETPENKDIPRDPFYIIYKKIISKGGEPIYIKNLKKKYKISKAVFVPINWDSPLFIEVDTPECKAPTKTYQLYNDLVNKYLDIKPFKDKFITDNETFYYPESVLKSYKDNIKFDKIVTFQWRRVWPKKRKGQNRIIANAQQLADKLASKLPKNILVRLINNAKFTMEEQISLQEILII